MMDWSEEIVFEDRVGIIINNMFDKLRIEMLTVFEEIYEEIKGAIDDG